MCKEIIMPGAYENRIVGVKDGKAIKISKNQEGGHCLCPLSFVQMLHLIADNLEVPIATGVHSETGIAYECKRQVDALIITREEAFGEYKVRLVLVDDD